MMSMNPARRGSLIAATWLIGLGVVFLVRELAQISWAQAWPMFVILAGVASFASIAVGGPVVGEPWAFDGVAARIRTRVILGSVDVDEARFPRVAGGYESPEYVSAANRVDIDVQGGVGSLRVRSG